MKLKIVFAQARSWHGSWTGNKDPLNFRVVDGLGKCNIKANHLLYSSDLNLDKHISHCAIMKVNEKKLSKCQFHFPRQLVACRKLKKSENECGPCGQRG